MSDEHAYHILLEYLKRIEAQNESQIRLLTEHNSEVEGIEREMHRHILAQERDMVSVHGSLDHYRVQLHVLAISLLIGAGFLGSALGYLLTKLH